MEKGFFKKVVLSLAGLLLGLIIAVFLSAHLNPETETALTLGKKGANISVDGVPDEVVDGALKTYVPPGQHDEYYMMTSGGHSGSLFVYGVPSMRRIRTIPVFTPESATGYGWTTETKEMLGGWSWGDLHHPALSETNGDYDGRWLFVNDNANSRAARIDLDCFKTKQILGPVPNIYGPHGAVYVTPNTEYFMMASRFAGPIPHGTYSPIENFKKDYHCVLAAIAIDPEDGEMSLGWEVLLPPWSFDLSDAGKLDSEGWCFLTSYNTEEAHELLEVNASQREMDYVLALNWRMFEQAEADGKYTIIDGAKVIDPKDVPGGIYLIPAMKSPHGVDVTPDGKYIVANGKVAPVASVFSFEKFMECVQNKDFQGEERGFPIVNYEKVRVAEIEVGLGPLHTQFDKEYGYTTLFIDSAIAKWSLDTFEVVDKIPVHYCPGHLCAAEGDTVDPDGKYLVSLNKLAKDKFLSVGPSHPESAQLIDLTTDKMKILMDVPTDPEPHFAQMIKADKIKTWEVYDKDPNRPGAVYEKEDARVERDGNNVTVYQMCFRSRYYPDHVEVNEGDHVTWYLTNTDFDEDITHGWSICLYDIDMEAQPGETVRIDFDADKPGVWPFYCTNFCSALHQEMQGWFTVKPK